MVTNHFRLQFLRSDVYKHVARTFDHSLKNMPDEVSGTRNVYNYNIALDGSWDLEELKIVAVLLNSDGQVSNANDATLEAAKAIGFETSGTEKILMNTGLQVFPNPATDQISVELVLTNSSNVEVSLVDIQGRTILVKDFGVHQGGVALPLTFKGTAAGVYTAMVRTNEGIATKKIVLR